MKQTSEASTVVPERPCNLCGSARAEIVSERDRRGQPLRTLLCPGYGFAFSDPRPKAEELEGYYRDDYRQEYKGAQVPRAMQVYRNTIAAQDRLQRVRPYLSDRGTLLDIGSGSGEFLYLAQKAGYTVRGLEPDVGYSAYTVGKLGLDVDSRALTPPAPDGAPFTTITIFRVLEHLGDPREALATLASWLTDAGTLVVEVPNIESRCTAPHHRFHRAHLFHFNLVSLTAMGGAVGLRVLETITSSDGGTITVVFTRGEPGGHRQSLAGNAGRVRKALDGYTDFRHYLGGTLFRQRLSELRNNIRGRWACRGVSDPVGVLERTAGGR